MTEKGKETQSNKPLKIPLDFKQTVMAALETKPESRKTAKKKPKT